MKTENLFYKEHDIEGNDIIIIFHKEPSYIFNESAINPIVKFTLTNCRNLDNITFDNIDYYNDGLDIDTTIENGLTVFQIIDKIGSSTKIFCDQVVREDLKYRQTDLVDFIKSAKKEIDADYDKIAILNNKIGDLANSLKHDLDIIDRKLAEASWLTNDKKQFLEGQKTIIQNILQSLG